MLGMTAPDGRDEQPKRSNEQRVSCSDLQAIDGEKPTNNALLQASAQDNRIVLFVHLDFEDLSACTIPG